MRDPHVEALYFKVSSAKDISYENPEPLSFSNHLGDFCLANQMLKVLPAEHFPTGQEASYAIEGFLRSWEIEVDLKRNLGTIRFTYSHADTVDRSPPVLDEPQVVHFQGRSVIAIGATANCHLVLKRYPEPPVLFSASEYAHYAYRRWLGYRNGSEPLLSMAYFILTLLERQAGGRTNACVLFNVEREVLDRLGQWSSERGSALTARKAKSTDFDDLSQIEREWLEQAAKRLIFRLGEQISDQRLNQITMDNIEQF